VTRLVRHSFPKKGRELDRLLWLAIGSAEGDYLDVTEAVEAEMGPASEGPAEVGEVSREDLVRAIREHGRSPTRIAAALSLKNRYVIHRLMKKYGLGGGQGEDET
jgi:transcriptional regulator of acetoin/glycerol metabolism